jgi:hypothetical protein
MFQLLEEISKIENYLSSMKNFALYVSGKTFVVDETGGWMIVRLDTTSTGGSGTYLSELSCCFPKLYFRVLASLNYYSNFIDFTPRDYYRFKEIHKIDLPKYIGGNYVGPEYENVFKNEENF